MLLALPDYFMNRAKSQVVIFLHLPKCGGTTISRIASMNYNPWRTFNYEISGRRCLNGAPLCLDCEQCPDVEDIVSFLKNNHHKIDLVLGHIPYGVHKYFGRKYYYITFVRNPVKRVWSQFHAIRQDETHYLYNILKKYNFNLGKTLESGEVFEFCNDQSRMLLGTSGYALDETNIDRVINRVENDIDYIGDTVNIDKDVTLLASKFGWKHAPVKRKNVGLYPRSSEVPDKDTMRLIIKYNRVDQALYAHVTNMRNRHHQ